MPTRLADKLPPEHAHLSFRAWRGTPNVMPRAHTHTDLEFNLPLGGELEYFFAGRFLRVPDEHFAVFWAGVPHRLTTQTAPEYLCLTLPLAWFLAWRIAGGAFAARLLAGELVSRPANIMETAQFSRWADDFASPLQPARERAALLEVEACLRRVALEMVCDAAPTPAQKIAGDVWSGITPNRAERIAARIGETFRDPELCVEAIADAVSLHPKYALAVFRAGCGMTMWDYVTRLRVSHAQRLLLTTGWSVERVAHESGFASAGRFFAAFKKQTGGTTPRHYRVQNG